MMMRMILVLITWMIMMSEIDSDDHDDNTGKTIFVDP